jgi:hypothetical protein
VAEAQRRGALIQHVLMVSCGDCTFGLLSASGLEMTAEDQDLVALVRARRGVREHTKARGAEEREVGQR